MRLLSVFCVPGGHTAQFIIGDEGEIKDPMETPPGWSLVKAEVVHAPQDATAPWRPGIWYHDESSTMQILHCPAHPPIEPSK
jgi:hypothetical protein